MSVNEAAIGGANPFAAVLKESLETIDRNQVVTFTRYTRVVLPLDGFVFWAKSELLSDGALFNVFQFNTTELNQLPGGERPVMRITVKGSLHFSTINKQDEAEGYAVNRMVFTSETEIDELNSPDPNTLWIADSPDGDGLRFAFSSRAMLFRQSALFHYQGDAVYPSLSSQLIETTAGFDFNNVVVSNSLPIWLTLNRYCPMFPAFLIPSNVTPPYCAVHVDPTSTRALQAAPQLDPTNQSHYQLATERVRLTFYGLRNFTALDFLDYVNAYSLGRDAFGIMNSPVPRDEKQTQSELTVIAQKKTLEFEINYHQTRIRDLAVQYIQSAFLTLYSE